MLQILPEDMLREVVKYITPYDFKSLYEIMKDDESLNRFTIQCTCVIHFDLVNWFQTKQIRLELWRRERTIGGTYCTELNGHLHSFDDQPSRVTRTIMQWHKHGKLHRENGRAAVIQKISDDEWMDVSWFEDGNLIRTDCGYLPQYQLNA